MQRIVLICFLLLYGGDYASGAETDDAFTSFRRDIRGFYEYAISHAPSAEKEEPTVVQLHGDPHIENFGLWRTAEGEIRFGLIDFDQTTRGPFYIDIERCGVGLVLLSLEKNPGNERKVIETFLGSYIEALGRKRGKDFRKTFPLIRKVWNRGEQGTRLGLLNGYGKTQVGENGKRRFNKRSDFIPLDIAGIEPCLSKYLESLPPAYRKEREFYKIKDAVEVKGWGVGSRENIKYRLLIEGPTAGQDDDYILELKEARPPALSHTRKFSEESNNAVRICEGQKVVQKEVSPFLGYTSFNGRDFFAGEVYPSYAAVEADDLAGLKDFLDFASVSAEVLAEAHRPGVLEGIGDNRKQIFKEIEDVIIDYGYMVKLRTLSKNLDMAREEWMDSLGDKFAEEELKNSYKEMQDFCRYILKSEGGFKNDEMQGLASPARFPYEVYYNDLYIEANNLKEQLFNILMPGTIANSYYKRPSPENLILLKDLFDRVYKYYVNRSYSWNRYLNKYLFQKSRLEHFLAEWNYWDRRYRDSRERETGGEDLIRITERARFCYERLKKECLTNNLPFAGEVNAFYLSKNFEDYYEVCHTWDGIQKLREEKNYEKEAVILIHGLGEDRSSWKELPRLLAYEDTLNPLPEKYFKVYLFRFDTIEDSKSVMNFARELSGFIREVQERENADKVNIICHSLGGVLTLKYLAKNTDPDFDLRPSGDEMRPILTREEILEGLRENRFRNNIKRVIAIAPSFSGSKTANVVVEMFRKKEWWFQESVKAIERGDVPSKGDIQVEENRLGSSVNLDSFLRLDSEMPLEMPGKSRVRVLTIIGNPPLTTSHSGDYKGRKEFRLKEDDGLVAVYSANLNHSYFADSELKKGIGYKKGAVAYLPMGHFEIIGITSMDHPSYKHIVSFLNDTPVEQEMPVVRTFGVILRIFPSDGAQENPPVFFGPAAKDCYIKGRLVNLSPVGVEYAGEALPRERVWNEDSGACFEEGSFSDDNIEGGALIYRLQAPGYKPRTVSVPVRRGEITYVPHLVLEKDTGP